MIELLAFGHFGFQKKKKWDQFGWNFVHCVVWFLSKLVSDVSDLVCYSVTCFTCDICKPAKLNWTFVLVWSFLSKYSNSAYFSFVKLSKSSYESSHKNSISLKCYWVKTFLGMILTRKSINPKSKTKLRSAPLPSKKKQFDLKNSFTKVSDDVSMTSERELGGESPKISNWRK